MFTRSILSKTPTLPKKTPFFSTNRAYLSTSRPSTFRRNAKRIALLSGSTLTATGLFFFLSQDKDYVEDAFGAHERVPYLAFYPQRGGAKNLPVISHQLDDDIEHENKKPRLVIVGGGWGAVSVLNNLDKDKYNVTLVSENNYFLFTPLLPSATVGTLELRSLIEPVRKILARVKGHFLEGHAVDIDINEKYLEVEGKNGKGNYYIPYDKLIVGVGATSITHGVEGLEHTQQLKTIRDAIDIRRKVTENVEKACLPTTTPEERKQLLSFVICGGGPTGVEFAAEMFDWINEDLVRWFPKLIREDISISIIQSRDHILNTFDSKISDYAEKRFDREHINIITNARVERINEKEVVYKLKAKDSHGEPLIQKIPYGLCLWSTGIAMTPFAKKITEKLEAQAHKRVLTTDVYMHLNGVEDESIFALGDCATIENPNLVEHIMEFIEIADKDKDGILQFDEFRDLCKTLTSKYPLTSQHIVNLQNMFEEYDKDNSGDLDLSEIKTMLKDIDSKMTHLPATAQVASQQGQYLAKYLNRLAESGNEQATKSAVGAFRYNHLGALAYLGNTAVGDFNFGFQMIGGLWALYLWRSVYWSEQVSMRTRMNLSLDWSKCAIWGRDISTV
ncbi:nucleotide-binding domain-containing protein [Backusella circina FSU 941]|nr:nucleotide-binding domain-containing protein [Backusella circina FSU 941]